MPVWKMDDWADVSDNAKRITPRRNKNVQISVDSKFLYINGFACPTGTGATGQIMQCGGTGISWVDPPFGGETGVQGPTGSQGETGAQGLIGETGLDGAYAGQGVTGVQGETGIDGPTGMIGPTGIIGSTGSQGETGLDGAYAGQGVTGLQGPVGQTGSQGHTGIQGLVGQTGAQGITGLAGAYAAIGATGLQGAQGYTGIRGLEGSGVTGIINVNITNFDSYISDGLKGNFRMPYNFRIYDWVVLGDSTGYVTLNVYKATYSGYPPTPTGLISLGGTAPNLIAQSKNSGTATGWLGATGAAGDIFRIEASGTTGLNLITLIMGFSKL